MRNGLTGWLSPEGTFHPCLHGEHYLLAQRLMEANKALESERIRMGFEKGTVLGKEEALKLMQWIPMGIDKHSTEGESDYLFINIDSGVTPEQKEWLESEKSQLTAGQKEMASKALYWLERKLEK